MNFSGGFHQRVQAALKVLGQNFIGQALAMVGIPHLFYPPIERRRNLSAPARKKIFTSNPLFFACWDRIFSSCLLKGTQLEGEVPFRPFPKNKKQNLKKEFANETNEST